MLVILTYFALIGFLKNLILWSGELTRLPKVKFVIFVQVLPLLLVSM